MAFVAKKIESKQKNHTFEIEFKTLDIYKAFSYQSFIGEIILPITGGMMDEQSNVSEDDIFGNKSTMFKDLFTHLAKSLSDPRMQELFAEMMEGAQYKCPITKQQKPLNPEELFDGDFAFMNDVFMQALEVNFSHLFTEGGILKSLTGKTLGLLSTEIE